MNVVTPPMPPRSRDPVDREELESLVRALIEEARRRARRRRRRNATYALLAAAAGVGIYFGVARATTQSGSAASVVSGSGFASRSVRNGPLTLFIPGSNHIGGPVARIVTVGHGRSKTIWRCPRAIWCGQAVSFDWAPDGEHLAFTLDEIGGSSTYVGLHVVNVSTGEDTQVPPGAPVAPVARGDWARYLRKMLDTVGCWPASELAWSADGSSVSYRCSRGLGSHIDVLRLNGSRYRTVHTGTAANWPSWSPSGNRIAYSTALAPSERTGVFTVALDGTRKKRLAAGGVAPAWAPDGSVIAYQTRCGIRLVTPAGADVTPRPRVNHCGAIGLSGPPVWSPDGTQLAFETKAGIYVMDANGGHLRQVSRKSTTTWYGAIPGRPSWRPIR